MALPIINTNGTSREEHIALRLNAIDSLNAALEDLRALLPHGRDYPGKSAEDVAELRAEHYAKLERLVTLRESIYQEAVLLKIGSL